MEGKSQAIIGTNPNKKRKESNDMEILQTIAAMNVA